MQNIIQFSPQELNIINKISQNLSSTMQILDCIVDHHNPINSMIVSGAPGTGKSWNIKNKLQHLHNQGMINLSACTGKSSTGGLYEALYNARHKYSVLLLDDVEVFDSEDKINILKAALDTNPIRNISWMTRTSSHLPQSFDFHGAVIFITNNNIKEDLKKNSNLSVHLNAILSRSIFVDLEIHDKMTIKLHVLNVLINSPMLKSLKLNEHQINEIIHFIHHYGESINDLSLRTPVLLSGLITKFPQQWQNIAIQRLTK